MKINIEINEAGRSEDGLAAIIVKVPEDETEVRLALPFDSLYELYGVPDETSLDFLLIAGLCYVIDKMVARRDTIDFWTRNLEVEFPVADVAIWNDSLDNLTKAVNFLTGDVWSISFRKRKEKVFQAPPPKRRRNPLPKLKTIDAVCSFSGGVDSFIGALDLLESNEFEGIQLLGHYDAPGAKSAQQSLFKQVKAEYPGKAELLQVRVSQIPGKTNESTLRSRSLVFIALGIYVARADGENVPVFMPENGFIALNIPLTPSRGGSCSTRTMHPYFLTKLGGALEKLGINNKIINGLELKTKGECVTQCANRQLLTSIIDRTVSCSHGTRKQNWVRRGRQVKNCGYCVPCLIRRAALNTLDLDKSQLYGIDVCQGELTYDDQKSSANDLRAVVNTLVANKKESDFKGDIIGIAPTDKLDERAKLLVRGFNEIKTLFRDKASPAILNSFGLESVE
ncbi:MAG TPA: Qat anti-phage system QueC-like protein QatC [Pyrinomonadaceae bacterium]